MRLMSLAACALAATFIGLFAEPLAAQTAEQLTFIPAGGRTLLSNIVASKPSADELKALLTGESWTSVWTFCSGVPTTFMSAFSSVSFRPVPLKIVATPCAKLLLPYWPKMCFMPASEAA